MAVFHVDLDNTLIFSYKHDIGQEKRCVEICQGREVSFITDKTYALLREISEQVLIVPTTTRTQEQYERICLGISRLPYALVCNGGVLLVDGKKDDEWYAQSLDLAKECGDGLRKAFSLLEDEAERELEVRFIEDLFVFTKCKEPEAVVQFLKKELDTRLLDVLQNGTKVYVIPRGLDKGRAVERFREYKRDGLVLAAGDSGFDVTMLEKADRAAAPRPLLESAPLSGHVVPMPGKAVYSEEVLGFIRDILIQERYKAQK